MACRSTHDFPPIGLQIIWQTAARLKQSNAHASRAIEKMLREDTRAKIREEAEDTNRRITKLTWLPLHPNSSVILINPSRHWLYVSLWLLSRLFKRSRLHEPDQSNSGVSERGKSWNDMWDISKSAIFDDVWRWNKFKENLVWFDRCGDRWCMHSAGPHISNAWGKLAKQHCVVQAR